MKLEQEVLQAILLANISYIYHRGWIVYHFIP